MVSFSPLTVERTVAEMYRLASVYRSDVVDQDWRTVQEVFNGVKMIPYRTDEGAAECRGASECVKRPGITLQLGGDCDDKAVLAAAGLTLISVPWRVVTVSYDDDQVLSHTYLEVREFGDERWRAFDATTPDLELYQERPFTKKIIWR